MLTYRDGSRNPKRPDPDSANICGTGRTSRPCCRHANSVAARACQANTPVTRPEGTVHPNPSSYLRYHTLSSSRCTTVPVGSDRFTGVA